MQMRTLGSHGVQVAALGLGCRGMSELYGQGNEAESIATIHRFLDLGGNLLDTADIYGPYENESFIKKATRCAPWLSHRPLPARVSGLEAVTRLVASTAGTHQKRQSRRSRRTSESPRSAKRRA
jgi:Aldo/keto reductase family